MDLICLPTLFVALFGSVYKYSAWTEVAQNEAYRSPTHRTSNATKFKQRQWLIIVVAVFAITISAIVF